LIEITEIDFAEIKKKIELGEFQGALNDLISLLIEDNYMSFPQILEGIMELQKKGSILSNEQFEKIKPWIFDFDETIQDLAFNIYSKKINREIEYFYNEIDLLTSRIEDFELGIRERVVGFLIKTYHILANREKNMIKGLISKLEDESWYVRMEIVRFLDMVLTDKPNFIKNFEDQLKMLYNEKDLDVKKEGLDFLLRLFIKTYEVEDLIKLINSLSDKEWPTQENIIFLIGKLGVHRKDLIEPVSKKLLSLLDHEDYLVRNAIKNIIEEILEAHEKIFDDALFNILENDEIDNLETVEEILKISIFKNDFERFYYLFNLIDPNYDAIITTFNNIIKKINLSDPNFMNSLISQLTKNLLKNLSSENYSKLKLILKANPYDNIYLQSYQVLNEIDFIDNREAERRRQLLLDFLLERKPELSFSKVKKWLEAKLVDGPINIKEISDKFHINEDQIKTYLENIIEKEKLNAILSNNIVDIKTTSSFKGEDLLFLKKWKISENLENPDKHDIKLFIHIRNISGSLINNLSIDIEYPSDIFNLTMENQEEILKILEPDQDLVLAYIFEKKSEKIVNPKISNINIIFTYEKEGQILNIEKYLDVLLV